MLAPTGRTMLVDAGANQRGWDAGERVIVPYLRERGVRSIDRAVISHGDGDHWGGLAYLADHMGIKELVLARGVPLGPLDELVPELEAGGTALRWAQAGDTLQPFGALESVVVHPSPRFEELWGDELGDDLNDRSLVLRVTYGHVVFLLCGDVEHVAEEWLVGGCRDVAECSQESPSEKEGDHTGDAGVMPAGRAGECGGEGRAASWADLLDCTVLKVPHHGSDTSSSEEFVMRASPLLAVISCGAKELFNLPKPDVLKRYGALGVPLMLTVRDGAVIVRTDGQTMRVTPYLRKSEEFQMSAAVGP